MNIGISMGISASARAAAPPVAFTSPAPGTELKANVAQSVTVEGEDGAYDLVIAGNVRGTLTVTGGTGTDDITPTADDIGATQIAVRTSGGGTNLNTLAVTAVRWRYLYEFFTPANVLWYLSPRVNLTLNGSDIAALDALDGNGDALPASDVAQATAANQFQHIADDIDFDGPSAHADSGDQWIGNDDATTNPYPITRIAIGRSGTSINAVYLLGGSTTAGVSCATFKRALADGGTWAVYNGSVIDTEIEPDPSQPGIFISYFDTGAAFMRQVLRDGSDETSTPGNAGSGGLRGTSWGAAINSGSGASTNVDAKFHEELSLSGVPGTAQIDALLADWATRPHWLATPLGKTSFAAAQKVVDTADYAAWPYGNMHHDSTRGITWMLYTEGSTHFATDRTLYLREINTTTDTLGAAQLVAAPEGGLGVTCLSSGICPNGDWIVTASYRPTSGVDHIDILRSTDGGQNWINEGEMSTPGGQTIKEAHYQGSAQGWIVTQAGTIIVGYRDFEFDNELDLLRSTDNAQTWTHYTLDNGSIPNSEPLEPAFWQHPTTGRIVMKIRPGNANNIVEPLFSYSDDDGLTWTPFVTTHAHEQYYNPAAIVYHADLEIVEMFMGSRAGHPSDALGSIWRVTATPDQAAANIWSKPERIFTMQPSQPNSGYPAAVRVGSKVYLAWYDGSDSDTDIWLAVGTAPA